MVADGVMLSISIVVESFWRIVGEGFVEVDKVSSTTSNPGSIGWSNIEGTLLGFFPVYLAPLEVL